jgi:hypothetical protein
MCCVSNTSHGSARVSSGRKRRKTEQEDNHLDGDCHQYPQTVVIGDN